MRSDCLLFCVFPAFFDTPYAYPAFRAFRFLTGTAADFYSIFIFSVSVLRCQHRAEESRKPCFEICDRLIRISVTLHGFLIAFQKDDLLVHKPQRPVRHFGLSQAIPSFATAPALIIVGFYMLSNVAGINFSDYSEGIPCFICIAAMPFCYSISEGISMGVISYVVINVLTGKAKEKKISVLMYVLVILFILKYIFL